MPGIPLVITGPAVVVFAGQTYYFQDGLKGSLKRNTESIKVDNFGEIAQVAKNFIVEFTGKPAGVLSATYVSSMFPDARSNHGKSVFGSTDVPLIVWALHPHDVTDLNKVTWARGAISKSPTLMLSATKGQIIGGEMTFACAPASNFNLLDPAAWYTAVNATYTGSALNLDLIRYARYTAALGARPDPYNAMIAQDGFTLEATFGTKDIEVDNFGFVDRVYDADSYVASVKFKPANMTKAQVDALINLQGPTALLPGDVIGGTAEDLVISSTPMTVTLKNCMAADSNDLYQTGVLQRGEVQFFNACHFVSGIPSPAITFSSVG